MIPEVATLLSMVARLSLSSHRSVLSRRRRLKHPAFMCFCFSLSFFTFFFLSCCHFSLVLLLQWLVARWLCSRHHPFAPPTLEITYVLLQALGLAKEPFTGHVQSRSLDKSTHNYVMKVCAGSPSYSATMREHGLKQCFWCTLLSSRVPSLSSSSTSRCFLLIKVLPTT